MGAGRCGWVQEVYGCVLTVWWDPLGGGWLRGGDILGGGVGEDLTGGLLTLGMGEGVMGERELLTKEIVSVGGVL